MLLLALQQGAVVNATCGLHFDFGFFVIRDVLAGLRCDHQRLRAVLQLEGALELQFLHAALLACIFLQCRLECLGLRMQLVRHR